MEPKKKKVYRILISIFLSCYIITLLYFSLAPQDPRPEGQFIFPGDERFEQLFANLMIPISFLVSGIISTFIFTRFLLKKYAKSLMKFQKVGIVHIEKLEGYILWRKLMIRAALSALLTINITLTLASQEIIVQFLRSVNPNKFYIIPDYITMFMLLLKLIILEIFYFLVRYASNKCNPMPIPHPAIANALQGNPGENTTLRITKYMLTKMYTIK